MAKLMRVDMLEADLLGGLFYLRYMDDFVIMAPTRHRLRRAIKEVHAVIARLGLRLHATKRCIGKLSNGFDFLGYRVVPGRRLRTSAEGRRRFAEKFRRLYEQGADHRRLWRYAERNNSEIIAISSKDSSQCNRLGRHPFFAQLRFFRRN